MSIMKSHLEGINLNAQSYQNSLGNCYPGSGMSSLGGLYQPLNYVYAATIRKVSNGYVLSVGSSEYIFESVESMVSKLKEVLEPKNGA